MANNKHKTKNTKACSGSNNIHGQWHIIFALRTLVNCVYVLIYSSLFSPSGSKSDTRRKRKKLN